MDVARLAAASRIGVVRPRCTGYGAGGGASGAGGRARKPVAMRPAGRKTRE